MMNNLPKGMSHAEIKSNIKKLKGKGKNTMSEEKGDLIPISGLWKNSSQNGDTYLTGYLGQSKLIAFKNRYKESPEDKKPDYILYVTKGKKKEQAQENLVDDDL